MIVIESILRFDILIACQLDLVLLRVWTQFIIKIDVNLSLLSVLNTDNMCDSGLLSICRFCLKCNANGIYIMIYAVNPSSVNKAKENRQKEKLTC